MKAIITGLPEEMTDQEQQRYGKTLTLGMWAEGLPVDGVRVTFEED